MRNINPLHDNAPKCRILSESEENEVLDTLFIDKKMLPRIFEDDGMLIWYPAEVGDIVEEMHISESVGLEKIYRIVIPTPQIEK
jgi:DNA-directed RNA polymerase subunit H (RpoH/RPB5)